MNSSADDEKLNDDVSRQTARSNCDANNLSVNQNDVVEQEAVGSQKDVGVSKKEQKIYDKIFSLLGDFFCRIVIVFN